MNLAGIHHLTAVTADARGNKAFYTDALGMRLVKKSVNQDDVSSYHLFYADGKGSPGTDITFFDWPATRERRGTRSIVRTGLRIGKGSFDFWSRRLSYLQLDHSGVLQRDGQTTIDFADREGQRLSLIEDDDKGGPHPWDRSPVPAEHQIRGLGPITLSVPSLAGTQNVITAALNMTLVRTYTGVASDGGTQEASVHVFALNDSGGPGAELHIAVEPQLPIATLGAGGVHHVAFRVPTFTDYERWTQRLSDQGIRNSGPINRYYFRSLYFREPNGILFELATDEPGFGADESLDKLGETLALPPFLEPRRQQIESGLKPLD